MFAVLRSFLCMLMVSSALFNVSVWGQNSDESAAMGKAFLSAKHVLFLGDSITASGGYIANIEAWLLTQKMSQTPLIMNGGLASETVSGLSEEGHAGGKFPRPDLFERLTRILEISKPDLVFACYGINCGIYLPLDDSRFNKYQEGFTKLKKQVEQAGAKLIIVTPPYFDDQIAKKSFSYNGVLDKYADWLISQRQQGWWVIDLHHPMTQAVMKKREMEAKFTFSPDAVHPNAQGHWFMAQNIVTALGDSSVTNFESPQAMLAAHGYSEKTHSLVTQRMSVLRDAYVGTAGHKRPGVAKGLPMSEAVQKAEALSKSILAEKK
jgi:lysophospholipase L1-like esterase